MLLFPQHKNLFRSKYCKILFQGNAQLTFNCSMSAIEKLEKGGRYVQS